MKSLRLGVNIDHVATLRNARGSPYPDPVRAARFAREAGADIITMHLREDRRHIRDADVESLSFVDEIPKRGPRAQMRSRAEDLTTGCPAGACGGTAPFFHGVVDSIYQDTDEDSILSFRRDELIPEMRLLWDRAHAYHLQTMRLEAGIRKAYAMEGP